MTSGEFRPLGQKERIEDLDILRGFALFGILLINWRSPTFGNFVVEPGSSADAGIRAAAELLVHQKIYPLFSILFGIGMALQIERLSQRTSSFDAYFVRRLAILFSLGIAHQFLLWNGDVLHVYAIAGFVLLGCRRLPDSALVSMGILLLVIPELTGMISPAIIPSVPTPQGPHGLIGTVDPVPVLGLTYWELVSARVTDFLVRQAYLRTYLGVADVAGLFMLGLVIGRAGVVQHLGDHRRVVKVAAVSGSILGLVGLGWDFVLRRVHMISDISPGLANIAHSVLGNDVLRACVKGWSKPALGIAYGAILLLILQHSHCKRPLRILAAIGRTTLTNYLLISLLGGLIFFGYGLGYHTRLDWSKGVLLVCGFYCFQVLISAAWLRSFRYGPVEWLWRVLSYGAWHGFNKSAGEREARKL